MTKVALNGVRVLDLSHYVAGPYCTKLLAAFGAEVIKIEKPGQGDSARKAGPFLNSIPHPEKSALFLYLNTGKKSITLNLKTQTGISIFMDLIKEADILVENFEPRVMPELGLDYRSLQQINPKLVMTSISNFGSSGPYRDYKGSSLVSYALGGYLYINGDPEREPLKGPGMQPAYQGGLHAFVGSMAALRARQRTGKGQYVEVSIMECMTSLHQFTISRYSYAGRIQKRVGNRYMWAHPITIYPCLDGYVAVTASREDLLERLLLLMGMEHLREDPRFKTGPDCLANADAFDELVVPWFKARSKKEIVQTCQEWRVPCAYVPSMEELLQDPHYQARGFWVEIDHPEAGKLPYAGGPFRMSETPWTAQRAPLLGEHNEEVYCQRLGYDKKDLVALRRGGII